MNERIKKLIKLIIKKTTFQFLLKLEHFMAIQVNGLQVFLNQYIQSKEIKISMKRQKNYLKIQTLSVFMEIVRNI